MESKGLSGALRGPRRGARYARDCHRRGQCRSGLVPVRGARGARTAGAPASASITARGASVRRKIKRSGTTLMFGRVNFLPVCAESSTLPPPTPQPLAPTPSHTSPRISLSDQPFTLPLLSPAPRPPTPLPRFMPPPCPPKPAPA